MKNFKISIIIPSRNRQNYVEDAINDLNNQTIALHEIIVVDQSDQPYNLDGCVYIHTKTLGPCYSRNIGIEKAKGDILVFLDDDIRLDNNFLEELVSPILNGQSLVVCGAVCNELGEYPFNSPEEYLEKEGDNFLKLLTSNPDYHGSKYTLSLPAGCFAIDRKLMLSIGNFDQYFDPSGAGEDRELALRLFKAGINILYNGSARLKHIGAPSGGSRKVGSRPVLLDIHMAYIIKKHLSKGLLEAYVHSLSSKYTKRLIKSFTTSKSFRGNLQAYLLVRIELRKLLK